ncbi:hypothetical protein HAX54_008041 [Datura stramonium]|uniref:Uncharacterized protein n=1 Tax=Datura stramonium TaxID=4076 RepID=A0ABS8TCK7_DATST|nr:hypothetical protein [Datura stramonium]
MGSQSQQLSDGFFCTQAPKVDIGKSSFVDGASTNAELKKELNDFRLHVDVKFGEILEALGHLTKKLEEKKSNECCYSRGGDTVFPDLGMDVDEDAYKVAPKSTLNVCEVGVGGKKTDIVGGRVHVGENIGEVNVNEQVSQPNFSFVSMPTINVNVAVYDKAVVDGGVPRQDVAQPTTYVVVEVDHTLGSVARVGNELTSGVFVKGVTVNESVVDPPSKDATCEALVGQVAYEVPVRVIYTFTESEHDSRECEISPGSTVVEIGDDDKTPAVY